MNRIARVNNGTVPQYWVDGLAARSSTGAFSTNGQQLYSYDLLIGDTCDKTGAKILRDYTARGKWGYQSQTTSTHVGKARQYATIID